MTRVRAILRYDRITGFEVSGHSDYADSGEDIVCAAISAITQTCEIGLRDVLGLEPEVRRDDEAGYYRLQLDADTPADAMRDAQLLFKTMLAGLHSIELGYPDFIRIDANNRRWN